jgi:hypothetical protein
MNESNLRAMRTMITESVPSLIVNKEIIDATNIDNALLNLTDMINYAYNHCCPLVTRTVTPKNKQKPWITRDVSVNIKKRHAYLVLLHEGKITSAVNNMFRNYVTNQIKFSNKNYYALIFSLFKNDIKKTWNLLNSIYRPKKHTANKIESITQDGKTYNGQMEIANRFNNFFVNIGKNITDSSPTDSTQHLKYMEHVHENNSFFFAPTNACDVLNVINNSKNKSSGLKSFSAKILKCIAELISLALAEIIHWSTSKMLPRPE